MSTPVEDTPEEIILLEPPVVRFAKFSMVINVT